MARKKAEEKQPMPAIADNKTEAKPVRLEMVPRFHRLLRMAAADTGTSMALYSREVMEQHLAELAKKKGWE